MSGTARLVLASRSPRRRALLDGLGLDYLADAAPDDGPPLVGTPAERVLGHARHKAEAVATRHPGAWVLAADTLVFLAGGDLPQPRDRADAERMLRALSGRVHEVWTGTVLRGPERRLERAERARVRFAAIPEDALQAWLASGGWQGKAGAYGIQDAGVSWASLEDGALGTVVGLDAGTVLGLLAEAGLPSAPSGG